MRARRLLPLLALLLAGCPGRSGDEEPSSYSAEECSEPTEAAYPYEPPAEFVPVEPSCDVDCLQRAIHQAAAADHKTVGLERGQEYSFGGSLWVVDGVRLAAYGDSTRPLPVLRVTAPPGLMGRTGSTFENLDIRGPHYGETDYPVHFHESWLWPGINFAGEGETDWAVLGTSVDGFPGTGVLGVRAKRIRIIGSRFAHNGYSGLSLFSSEIDGETYCGAGNVVVGSLFESNGQDGFDSCPDSTRYENNVARWNGWYGHPGDQNGLLVFAYPQGVRDVELSDNLSCENEGAGIKVAGAELRRIVLRGNTTLGNGLPGVFLNRDTADLWEDVRVIRHRSAGETATRIVEAQR